MRAPINAFASDLPIAFEIDLMLEGGTEKVAAAGSLVPVCSRWIA